MAAPSAWGRGSELRSHGSTLERLAGAGSAPGVQGRVPALPPPPLRAGGVELLLGVVLRDLHLEVAALQDADQLVQLRVDALELLDHRELACARVGQGVVGMGLAD